MAARVVVAHSSWIVVKRIGWTKDNAFSGVVAINLNFVENGREAKEHLILGWPKETVASFVVLSFWIIEHE